MPSCIVISNIFSLCLIFGVLGCCLKLRLSIVEFLKLNVCAYTSVCFSCVKCGALCLFKLCLIYCVLLFLNYGVSSCLSVCFRLFYLLITKIFKRFTCVAVSVILNILSGKGCLDVIFIFLLYITLERNRVRVDFAAGDFPLIFRHLCHNDSIFIIRKTGAINRSVIIDVVLNG